MKRFAPGIPASLDGSGEVLPPQQTLAFLSRSAHNQPISNQPSSKIMSISPKKPSMIVQTKQAHNLLNLTKSLSIQVIQAATKFDQLVNQIRQANPAAAEALDNQAKAMAQELGRFADEQEEAANRQS